MTNAEKYKTAYERTRALANFCGSRDCLECLIGFSGANRTTKCSFLWLELEAEAEEPLPCPFCGGKCSVETVKDEDSETGEVNSGISVLCYGQAGVGCGYQAAWAMDESSAIEAHNRVARAVKAAGESEAKDD